MKITISSGTTYRVWWQYESEPDMSQPKLSGYGQRQAITHCFLRPVNASFNVVYTHSGTARCAVSDKFSRNTGRKLSLTRAIASFPRGDRRLIWEAYHSQKGATPTSTSLV